MTDKTRKAIETLGHDLGLYPWELENTRIVCRAIDETEGHAELTFCPLAMAATLEPDRIYKLLQDAEHQNFREWVDQKRPGIRNHLIAQGRHRNPEDTEELERDAALYAAAAVVNDAPESVETRIILGLDESTINDIVAASDNADTETGRALIRALDRSSEWLGSMFEQSHGKLDAGPVAA